MLEPLRRFFRIGVAGGVVMLTAAAAALVWSNSPWGSSYAAFWQAPLAVRIGGARVSSSLHFVIDDGLMVFFFFFAGLEVRRELHSGALSGLRRAALPLVAAVGGMLAPAAIYLLFNGRSPARGGWGVPMATDIAFAVSVLALLGERVPAPLRVLLLALAVIDDIGSILVIAVFFSPGIHGAGALLALGGVALVVAFQRMQITLPALYFVPGAIVWLGLLRAGIHPTLAGVILGMMTPVGPSAHPPAAWATWLEARLYPWVSFGVLPLFALANGGVRLVDVPLAAPGSAAVLLGVAVGLVAGKPIGVLLASALCVRLRIAALPDGVRWTGIAVMGMVAGIGFTMSLFIAELAFPGPVLAVAKVAVLAASLTSAAIGLAAGRLALPAAPAR